MYSDPCAKLTTRVTPKISVSPALSRNSVEPYDRPATNWPKIRSTWNRAACQPPASLLRFGRAAPGGLGLRGQEVRAIGVAPVDHRSPAVTHAELADEGAHRRLVVDAAEHDRAEGRRPSEPAHGRDQLLGVGRLRLLQRLDDCGESGVADDRAQARVVLVALVVPVEELRVFGRRDLVPRIAGDDPAPRRLVPQHVEVLGLARQ